MNFLKSGLEKHILGMLDEALKEYSKITNSSHDYPFALNLKGVVAIQKGDYAKAVDLIMQAIAMNKLEPEFYCNLGEALRYLGKLDEAATCHHQALSINSRCSYAHNYLGLVLEAMGRPKEARLAYREAIRCTPTYSKAWENLTRISVALGETAEAEQCELHRSTLEPEDASINCYMGNMMKKLNRWDEARAFFRRAIELKPDYAIAHNNLGALYHDLGQFNEAASCFVSALSIQPGNVEALNNLGSVFKEQGDVEEAAKYFRKSLALQNDDGIRIRLAILVPIILESLDQIAAIRSEIVKNLAVLASKKLIINNPLVQVGTTTFYLSYHGEGNRELHSTLAHIYERNCPELLYIAPHCNKPSLPRKKIKVGFISSFMKKHSIGKTTAGLFAKISRDEFEMHALFAPPFVDDEYSRFILKYADETTLLDDLLPKARRQISCLGLDVLFYQDIGMDPYTYFLAFARLAPVQCVSFGHPDTTGIPTIDYFISSDLFEHESANEHYSEELFLLRGLGTLAYYYRPFVLQPGKSRCDFGLPEDSPLYICPQALFKFHPEFDQILVEILRRDSRGLLVILESKIPEHTYLLKKRLENAGSDVFTRIIFLPQQEHEDFINLIALADVMLDTIHFNGMNSNLEAFSVGTPVVTLPTLFQRGRHTLGMYLKMGILDCIALTADHYVEIALRLAGDPYLRNDIRSRILGASNCLYEDVMVVREFERFFKEAVERSDHKK